MAGIEWVRTEGSFAIPSNAIKVGKAPNGRVIYIGRSHHNNKLIPTQIMPTVKQASFVSNGETFEAERFSVLCSKSCAWKTFKNEYPPNVVVGGHYGSPTKVNFIGRVKKGSGYLMGVINPSNHTLFTTHDGNVNRDKSFEILVNEFN